MISHQEFEQCRVLWPHFFPKEGILTLKLYDQSRMALIRSFKEFFLSIEGAPYLPNVGKANEYVDIDLNSFSIALTHAQFR